ncbi:MAG: DnaJ domain-containing protein [Anaerolineales bacterium]
MQEITYYERLGLPRDATQEEIRRAYRQLVLRLHPDTNVNKGETGLFIDIQQAYEYLSDPKKKNDYDEQIPSEPDILTPLDIKTFYSQSSLVRLSEPQLLYVLLELNIKPDTKLWTASAPMNISLVVDCSTSMQGYRLDMVKLTAIDILRKLQQNDIFSLVKFNDWAELLIAPGSLSELKSAEMKVQLLQAGGGTEILKGLEMGFAQVKQFRSDQRVNHIILITDGRTYGDEANCVLLAEQSSTLGIGISALGIGTQWNDKFLDHITSKTGGICKYIPDGGDIRNSILEEISRLGSNMTEKISTNYQLSQEVELSAAYRLQPDPSSLNIISPLILGNIPHRGILSVIYEFVIHDIPENTNLFTLAKGFLDLEIPRHTVKSRYFHRLKFDRKITSKPEKYVPPTAILNAMTMLSVLHLQERAREAMNRGDYLSAAHHMEYLATHLLKNGEESLAKSVLHEVTYIRHNQSFSEEGQKRIKYGTRSLLLPASVDEA